MCIPFGFESPISTGIGLTYGEWLATTGLLLDLIGIALLTFSGIFGEEPIRRLWNLHKNIDRDSLEESDTTSKDLAMTRTIDRPPDDDLSHEPINTADYDALKSRLVRSISGAAFLATGLFLQLVGSIIC